MRLLYVLDAYWPHVGGAETLFSTLCELMAERGHEVVVLTRRDREAPAREVHRGVTIRRIAAPNVYLFALAAIVPAIRAAGAADVIHTTTFASTVPASIAAFVRGRPIALSVLETWVGGWQRYTDFSALRCRVHDSIERATLALPFDRYLPLSEATRVNLARVLPARAANSTTIYPGFDPQPWSERPDDAARADVRARHGIEPGAFLVVAYGRPGTSKGFKYLIEAFPHIEAGGSPVRGILVLSTAPAYARARAALARDLPAGLTVSPSLARADLVDLVQAADCVVVPSLTEGFGYAVLEANAAGVPVVASDVTSIPEVVSGRYLLVAPRDPAAIAAAVSAVARGAWIETPQKHFAWSETADRHERVYHDLVPAAR